MGDPEIDYSGGATSIYAQLAAEAQKEVDAINAALAQLQSQRVQAPVSDWWNKASVQQQRDTVAAIDKKISLLTSARSQRIDDLQAARKSHTEAAIKQQTTSTKNAASSALSARRAYLQDALAMGKLDTDRAKEEWDRAKDITSAWTKAVTDSFSFAEKVAPKWVTQEDLDDYWAQIKGLERFGAKVPGNAPKPVDLSQLTKPYMEALKEYMPPKVEDWQKVLSNMPSGLGTPPIPEAMYTAAGVPSEPEKVPVTPLPKSNYTDVDKILGPGGLGPASGGISIGAGSGPVSSLPVPPSSSRLGGVKFGLDEDTSQVIAPPRGQLDLSALFQPYAGSGEDEDEDVNQYSFED